MRRHPLPSALLALLLAGCASAELRPLTPAERRPLAETLDPLLRAAYGADVGRCRLAVATRDEEHFDASLLRGPEGPCDLRLALTTATLTRLTPKALQTLLAHELAHVERGHATGAERIATTQHARRDGGVMRSGNQQFMPDEEAAADTAAARLLTVAWRGSNVGCLGLADLYEGIGRDRRRWGHWLSRHPFPERRVEAVVRACEQAQPRPR
jgi:hypothetical protein